MCNTVKASWLERLLKKYLGVHYVVLYRDDWQSHKYLVYPEWGGKVNYVVIHGSQHLLNNDGTVWGTYLRWKAVA